MTRWLIFIFLLIAGWGCGGGSGSGFLIFQRPIAVRASSTDIKYDGRSSRFMYVANQRGGSIAVVDQETENFVDTDGGDEWHDSFIAVGGEPSALAVVEGSNPRIYVVDELGRKLLAFDALPPTDPTYNVVKYRPVSLGGAKEARISLPIFRDQGRHSSPVMMNLSADPTKASTEQWKVAFDGSKYIVTGSKSGEQKGRASEGSTYKTDDGAVSFKVVSGAEPTDQDDIFRFAVSIANPLALTGRPVDLLTTDKKLIIVTEDPSEVLVFNLDTLVIDSTITLDDGSGKAAQIGPGAINGDHLYVPNRASSNVFDVDLNALTASVIATGVEARAAGFDSAHGLLYLIPDKSREIIPWEIAGGKALAKIRLADFGMSFQPYKSNGILYAAIGTSAGSLEIIDLSKRKRIDTQITGQQPESQAIGIDFEDQGPPSAPELISVNLVDGRAKTERWQLTFDVDNYIVSGSISGIQTGRAFEGTPYTSDDGSMSLTVRGSRGEPTTKGDYFTFLAVDGINSLRPASDKLATSLVILNRPNDETLTAYVTEKGTGDLSSFNLTTLEYRRSIR